MTLATDQNHQPYTLSATSRRMLELRDVVIAEWENRVRASVEQTGELSRSVLMDSLAIFYDNMAEAVTLGYPRATAVDGTSHSGEHGNQRARLTAYDPQALINEYQILRWALLDVLRQHGVRLSHEETVVINASFDSGIREAVNGFLMVHTALRQQFVAALTHDLRSPLATANVALELLLMEADPAKMKGLAVKAMDHLRRMDGMIRSLLDSMAFQNSQRMPLTLAHFDIAEVVKEVQSQTVATHHVRFQIFGGSVKGWWDREAVKRAIENLVGNAVKYGDMNKPIRISFAQEYERLILMVHNEGQPIPPEHQEEIFQPFRRAQAAASHTTQGWGIGLSFIRRVAESHGGSILIDSALERGTTFTLDLPLDSRPFQDAPSYAQAR